jgi:hypothetical protein
MNARNIRNRLLRIERKIQPEHDGAITLEALCRSMWRADKRKFLEMAKGTSFSLFVSQFEFEEAEHERKMRRQK